VPDPLVELALRVQLSGVPPAYGSWLLTPRPPLHEGEKQPVGQKSKGNCRSIHQTSGFFEKVKGLGRVGRFLRCRLFKRVFNFFPAWWVMYGEIGLRWTWPG